MDVILTTQHGFTMTVRVKVDKDGHSYFHADLWRKFSKFYVLKAGNKILVRAPHSGQINMDVYFPSVISRPQSDRG
jgi:formylmethanofuran dehydrogenase subunit A